MQISQYIQKAILHVLRLFYLVELFKFGASG